MRPNTQLFLIGLSGLLAIIFDFFNFFYWILRNKTPNDPIDSWVSFAFS